jgi:hypothetical protein
VLLPIHILNRFAALGSSIELLDVNGHQSRQKIVSVRAEWDFCGVGRFNDRELERDEKILGLRCVPFGGRADSPYDRALLGGDGSLRLSPVQHAAQRFLV